MPDTTSVCTRLLQCLYQDYLTPFLDERGFDRYGSGHAPIYRRWDGDRLQAITMTWQRSRGEGHTWLDRGMLALGFSIGFKSIARVLRGAGEEVDLNHPVLAACHVGYLREPYEYEWIEIGEGTDVTLIASDVLQTIEDSVLPTFDEFGTLVVIRNAIRATPQDRRPPGLFKIRRHAIAVAAIDFSFGESEPFLSIARTRLREARREYEKHRDAFRHIE